METRNDYQVHDKAYRSCCLVSHGSANRGALWRLPYGHLAVAKDQPHLSQADPPFAGLLALAAVRPGGMGRRQVCCRVTTMAEDIIFCAKTGRRIFDGNVVSLSF